MVNNTSSALSFSSLQTLADAALTALRSAETTGAAPASLERLAVSAASAHRAAATAGQEARVGSFELSEWTRAARKFSALAAKYRLAC